MVRGGEALRNIAHTLAHGLRQPRHAVRRRGRKPSHPTHARPSHRRAWRWLRRSSSECQSDWLLRVPERELKGSRPFASSSGDEQRLAASGAATDTHGIIPLGMRNNTLFHYALEQASNVDDFNGLLDVVETRNMECDPPLSGTKVIRAARSAWRYEQEGRNLMKRGRAVVIAHDVVDGLMHEDPDAFLLLIHLRRRHWGKNYQLLLMQ